MTLVHLFSHLLLTNPSFKSKPPPWHNCWPVSHQPDYFRRYPAPPAASPSQGIHSHMPISLLIDLCGSSGLIVSQASICLHFASSPLLTCGSSFQAANVNILCVLLDLIPMDSIWIRWEGYVTLFWWRNDCWCSFADHHSSFPGHLHEAISPRKLAYLSVFGRYVSQEWVELALSMMSFLTYFNFPVISQQEDSFHYWLQPPSKSPFATNKSIWNWFWREFWNLLSPQIFWCWHSYVAPTIGFLVVPPSWVYNVNVINNNTFGLPQNYLYIHVNN